MFTENPLKSLNPLKTVVTGYSRMNFHLIWTEGPYSVQINKYFGTLQIHNNWEAHIEEDCVIQSN